MVLTRALYLIEDRGILSPFQAGFRPGRSTLDQLLSLTQSISDGFHSPKPANRTVLATVDFSRAFDSVWHRGLLHKLCVMGFPPCFIRWVRSYLADRRAFVDFDNAHSRSFRLRYGVPQGSVLGPLLFLLFINDLPDILPPSVHFSLYADDLAIWSLSPSVDTATSSVQAALNALQIWSQKWLLPLNVAKCEGSFFSTDPRQAHLQVNLSLFNTPLNFNPTPIFLGVKFDRTLSFLPHVRGVQSRSAPRLKALKSISAKS
jgi:hypothetical protein